MMKTAVICDQKKSYGIFIQPSYRRQILAPPFSKKIQYCFLIPVFCRRDDTCRFIQHIVFITKIGYRFSCKNNLIISLTINPGSVIFSPLTCTAPFRMSRFNSVRVPIFISERNLSSRITSSSSASLPPFLLYKNKRNQIILCLHPTVKTHLVNKVSFFMLIWLNSFTAYQHFPRLFCCIHLSIF